MSRNGSGTYNLPAGNPVVTGTTITTTWANTTLNDIASSLTGSVAADGQTPMSGALNMANNKITALATPTASTDAVTKAYADALIVGNGTMATQNANAVAITGGTIDGTTIGTSTKADGKFTTLSANGDVSFTSTGFLLVPSGTTAQRPASPATGEMRYNTTLNQFEGYYTSAWSGLGSGAAGSNTQVQYNNAGALAGSSALTFNGTTLTVPKIAFASSNTPSLTNYQGGAIASGTVQNTTSGNTVTFSSIPSWVKRITIMFNQISTNGTTAPMMLIQIGSGSLVTTGYTNVCTTTGNGTSIQSFTTGFAVRGDQNAAALVSGTMTLTLFDASTNTWIESGVSAQTVSPYIFSSSGVLALSGTLDRVALVTADTFDAGSINILYE